MRSCSKAQIELGFVAGQDLEPGTAVWLHVHKLMRATSASLEVRIPLGGPVHTPMIIGVTRTKAKEGHKVPVVMHGHVRRKVPKEWMLKSAWATAYGAILPWHLVSTQSWAKKIGWFTETGVMVIIDHRSKKKQARKEKR